MTPALTALLLALPSAPPAPPAPPQGDGPPAARPLAHYHRDGQRHTVTAGDVALEMAFDQRHRDEGRAACEHLVATTLVRRAAAKAGIWPSPERVQELWRQLQQQLRAQGRDPQDVPVIRNSGLERFLDDLAVQLAHEALVRRQLGLGADEPVGGDMLQLWVVEARRAVPVVDDPDQLPVGTAVRVDGQAVPLLELGMLLLRMSDSGERDRFVRQVVVLQCIEAEARALGIEVTPEDLEHEIAARRLQAERDPRFRGMTFAQLLQSQGLSVDWLRHSRVFRAQLLQKKLAAVRHPREELLLEIARDREAVLARAGARRRLGLIFLRALDEPNPLVPRDFAAARAHLEEVRARLLTEEFDTVARIESEHAGSKGRGGDLGWLQRASDALPPAVMAAAFAQEPGQVAGPLDGPDGCYLVKVLDVEPEPTDDELVVRLREQAVERRNREILAEARITRPDGTPLDGSADEGQGQQDGAADKGAPGGPAGAAAPGRGR